MRRLLVLAMAVAIAIGLSHMAHAQEPTIEPDARIYESVSRDIAIALAQIVQIYGYRCDSVSAVTPFVFSAGYSVVCNNWRYSYEIEDTGGNIIVTVD